MISYITFLALWIAHNWPLTILQFMVTRPELLDSFNKFKIFQCSIVFIILLQLMNLKKSLRFFAAFHCLIIIVSPSLVPYFPVKLLCLINVCLWGYDFDGTKDLISFLLWNHCFLIFRRQVIHTLLASFDGMTKKRFIVS